MLLCSVRANKQVSNVWEAQPLARACASSLSVAPSADCIDVSDRQTDRQNGGHRYLNSHCVRGWSTSLPQPSTSVGPERSDTAHIPASSLRSHHWRSRQSSLATSARKDRLQGRCANAAWWRSAVGYLQQFTTSLLSTDSGPQSPTVCSFLLSDCLLSVAAPSLSLVLVCGTIYRRTLPPYRRCSQAATENIGALISLLVPGTINCFSPYIYSVILVVAVCCLDHVDNTGISRTILLLFVTLLCYWRM